MKHRSNEGNVCLVAECVMKARIRGFCARHYQQKWVKGEFKGDL